MVLADKLVTRDRDLDDRRICLECRHLSGVGQTSWRCGNWQAAGVAIRSRDSLLPADLVLLLQRCDGFSVHKTNQLQHERGLQAKVKTRPVLPICPKPLKRISKPYLHEPIYADQNLQYLRILQIFPSHTTSCR